MGSFDTYCAFCAGPLGSIDHAIDEFEAVEETEVDTRLRACADWLKGVRCIGINPEAQGVTKCFVSGLGTGIDYGQVAVRRGDDPNFSKKGLCYSEDDGERTWVFSAYHVYDGGIDPVFPFHDACMKIFKLTVDHQTHGPCRTIDNDALYQAFSSLNRLEYEAVLDIDYFELEPSKREQFFSLQSFGTTWVLDPLQVYEDLKTYCKTLPPIESASVAKPIISRASGTPSQDCFSELPEELILRILGFLPLDGVTSFRLASRAAAAAPLTNFVWRDIMFNEMPWLLDVFPHIHETIDNRRLFKAMRGASKSSSLESFKGLANRRRIWNTCLQIVPLYFANLMDEGPDSQTISDEIRWGSKSFSMPRVGQKAKEGHSCKFMTWFAASSQEIEEKESTLEVHWSAQHELCGFTLVVGPDSRTLGLKDAPNGYKDTFAFQKGDWLIGFIFNIHFIKLSTGEANCGITGVMALGRYSKTGFLGSQEGYKRIVECRIPGAVVTGIMAHIAGEVITRVGLLEYKKGSPTSVAPQYPGAKEYLWKDTLPPSIAEMASSRPGEWSTDLPIDLQPYEALILGTNQEELASVAAIAASPLLNYFEVQYSNGKPPRTIGKGAKVGIKSFPIDGQSGEKIIRATVSVTYAPRGLCVFTNFKRQCIFGEYAPGKVGSENTKGKAIYGLYANFGLSAGPSGSQLPRHVGVLAGSESTPSPPPEWDIALTDENGLCWEPSTPPYELKSTSKIYGKKDVLTRDTIPPQPITPTVTWIDFSRNITRISGLQAAYSTDTGSGEGQNGPFKVEYDDGFALAIPVTQLYVPPKKAKTKPSIGTFHEPTDIEQQSSEWQPAHGRVTGVTIWASEALEGLQFHDSAGDSPRWGKCGGTPTDKVDFDGSQPNSVMALKLFVCHEPPQIIAVQGMNAV